MINSNQTQNHYHPLAWPMHTLIQHTTLTSPFILGPKLSPVFLIPLHSQSFDSTHSPSTSLLLQTKTNPIITLHCPHPPTHSTLPLAHQTTTKIQTTTGINYLKETPKTLLAPKQFWTAQIISSYPRATNQCGKESGTPQDYKTQEKKEEGRK